jgi:membrane associated rhomboid family serine protease
MSTQISLLQLVGLLILLPWTVTYLHLHYYTFWQYEYCFVGPATPVTPDNPVDSDQWKIIYGIYAPLPNKKKKGQNALDRRTFRQRYSSSVHGVTTWHGWPSLTQAAIMISAPSSSLSKYNSNVYNRQDLSNNPHEIIFVDSNNENKWCLKSDQDQWCSTPSLPLQNDSQIIHQYPPSGIWIHTHNSKPSLHITCPTPATAHPTTKTKHTKQNGRQNQNLKFLLHHPTTSLLLLLNLFLCYQYWNHRIPPSAVSKSYHKICCEYEWWRSFTGATAHFEPLHIGFNMMSLYTLGQELEGGFGSVVFMIYNVAMVVMCSLVMMGMVYGRLWWERYRGREDEEKMRRLRETSTVGYSGVLFAWMVM